MIKKEYTKGIDQVYYRHFLSISEYVSFIKSQPVNFYFKKLVSETCTEEFSGTKSYSEAMDLLLHGWDSGAKEIAERFHNCIPVKIKQRNVYSVQGYQASVPRYLQGVPDNMIASRRIQEKQKVIKLYKSIAYNHKMSKETILSESMKVLRLVQKLEVSGIRVELNILEACTNKYCTLHEIHSICIKPSGQRLNIKQIAFPLVHPSMLRRVVLSYIERVPECNALDFADNYGLVRMDREVIEDLFKGSYVIPSIIPGEEIKDIQKYLW